MLPLIESPPSVSPLTPPSLEIFTDNEWEPLEEEEETKLLDSEEWPNVEHLVTEDEVPVDNFPSAKQQRLLIDSLYSSWHSPAGLFLADANIGIFSSLKQPPIVPDVFVSLGSVEMLVVTRSGLAVLKGLPILLRCPPLKPIPYLSPPTPAG